MTTDKAIQKLDNAFSKIEWLMSKINQLGISNAVDAAGEAFKTFKINPTNQRLSRLLDKCDAIRVACDCEVSFPDKGELTKIRNLCAYVDNFFNHSFDSNEVIFKQEQRKAHPTNGRFFKVYLTQNDSAIMFNSPEVVAQSVEQEFYPSTFIQFISNGMSQRFALMRKQPGND